MKKHSYGRLIGLSWEWLKEMLFRPFKLKKWIMLYLILLLAGYMAGGNFNINVGNRGDLEKVINELKQVKTEGIIAPQGAAPQVKVMPEVPPFFKDTKTVILLVSIAGVIGLFIVLFMLLWMWIASNFSFVVIDSVMKNDASLRVPFHRNKPQGNSYFRWNIVFTLISLLVFGAIITFPVKELIKAGVFSGASLNTGEILSTVLRYAPILITAVILFFLIGFFTREFVLPIMYKRKIAILKAWKVFLGLLGRNIGEMVKYVLLRILLSIAALVVVVIIAIIAIIAFLLVGGLAALLGWLIYAVMPAAAKPVILIVFVIIGVPVFLFLVFLFNVLFMPIPIFFRIFSINVLGSMDESLDLFAPKTPEEIAAEGNDAEYRKSMALVWFAVSFPVLIAIVGILAAISIPNFIKAREKALQRRQPAVGEIIRFQEKPKMSDISLKGISEKEFVTVYLKNGNSFKAEIEEESENDIAFKVEGGTFILSREDILRIEKQKEKKENGD